jgi:hypothetical protein
MPWRRPLLVLGVLTALLTAPSFASAAPPNQLLDGSVAPPAGTPSTPFVISVRYRSSSGTPATAVTATVAGRSIPLALSSGSAADGVWSAVTVLPAGSWMVRFSAKAGKGPQPSASAGPVAVDAPATPSHEPSPDGTQPDGPGEPYESPATPAPRPASSSVQSSRPAPVERSAAPAPSNAAPTQSSSTSRATPTGPSRRNGDPRPSVGGTAATTTPAIADPVASAPGTTDGTAPATDGGLVGLILLMGLVGVAAVAILGAAWIALASRRDTMASDMAASASDQAIAAIPTIDARAVRRARLRPSDDPILAALGLPDDRADTGPTAPSPGGDRTRARRRRGARD